VRTFILFAPPRTEFRVQTMQDAQYHFLYSIADCDGFSVNATFVDVPVTTCFAGAHIFGRSFRLKAQQFLLLTPQV
jgi:hypothetical protein